MKQKKVFLLAGPSAAGKSTWAAKQVEDDTTLSHNIVSRDMIRFSLLEDTDDYFAHEDEVFKKFIEAINSSIRRFENTYIDATHLTPKARHRVLSQLNLNNVTVTAINFHANAVDCKKRNQNRSGRARVPDTVIETMCKTFVPAKPTEQFIDEVKNITIISNEYGW